MEIRYILQKKQEDTKMGSMTHAAGRAAFSTALDVTLKNLNKKPEGEIVKLIDLM